MNSKNAKTNHSHHEFTYTHNVLFTRNKNPEAQHSPEWSTGCNQREIVKLGEINPNMAIHLNGSTFHIEEQAFTSGGKEPTN